MTTTSSGGTMRAVAYVRVTPKHHFTAEQFTDCQIVSADIGATFIRGFVDVVEPATSPADRPSLSALLDYLGSHEVAAVIVAEPEVLDADDTTRRGIISQIAERGARIYSIPPATGVVEELGHAA